MPRTPRVFTIPGGAPFLKTLAASLLDGTLAGPFDLAADPLALARATVFLPTRRAARAFSAELATAIDAPAVLLPRIVPLGDMDEAEGAMRADEAQAIASGLADLAPPVGAQERLLTLTSLVLAWARALDAAQTPRAPDEALMVASTPADACAMAAELAGLIDTLAIEGRTFADIEAASPDRFDRYWSITRDFLAIAAAQWPNILAERGLMDAAMHRDVTIRRRAHLYRAGEERPVIAAGSTGSMPATAELLAAIARLPRGAVVLPGLDLDLDDASFASILGDPAAGRPPEHGHPQALLARLLAMAGIPRRDVRVLGVPGHAARSRLLSEAMRPAESADRWATRDDADRSLFAASLDSVAVVEAADESEEALAIAIALREAIEEPGRTAALVTPDRSLALRVAASLGRWNIEIDDSAGSPLGQSPAGILARLVARIADGFDAAALLDLLVHPLASFGIDRAGITDAAAAIEIGVLRGALVHPGHAGELRAHIEAGRAALPRKHARDVARRLTAEQWDRAEALADRLVRVLSPLLAIGDGEMPLPAIARAHRIACEDVFASPSDAPDRAALDLLFDSLDRDGGDTFSLSLRDWPALFDRLADGIAVHPPARAHRRLKIWGLLEARLLEADRVVVGGLVEGTWPAVARADAFLNRGMRADIGLPAPERRIGQSAHDFVAACGAREVVLTSAAKTGGTPTVRSRFLRRLETCIGTDGDAWRVAVARGNRYLEWARGVDKPIGAARPAARPEPRPPAALQPPRLSVTAIETLVRDPYAIFANHVLGLDPLEPLAAGLDRRRFGTLVHGIIAAATIAGEGGGDPEAHFREAATRMMDELGVPSRSRALIEARLGRLALSWTRFDRERRQKLARVLPEVRGRIDETLADATTFTLTAVADRIEIERDGAIGIVDFKTGTPPGIREVAAGYAPQLTLEAAMLRRGGFAGVPGGRGVHALCLVKLASDGGSPKIADLATGSVRSAPIDVDAKAEEHFRRLMALLDDLRSGRRAFVSRRWPRMVRDDSPFNHLARFEEWARFGGDEG